MFVGSFKSLRWLLWDDASRHGEHAMRLCVLVGIAVLC